MERWTIHDLRRSARSMMARAGVPSEHAERVMGHSVGGVQNIYNKHSYADEKADALARLAGLIAGIVHPRGDKVVQMQKRAKQQG
jgi:integrase